MTSSEKFPLGEKKNLKMLIAKIEKKLTYYIVDVYVYNIWII